MFFHNKTFTFLLESDEFNFPSHFRCLAPNNLLINVAHSSNGSKISFDADSTLAIIDCGISSSATSNELDFINRTCEDFHGVAMSGIESGLQDSGIGSIMLPLKDDSSD